MEKNLSFIGFPNYTITDDGRVFSYRAGEKTEKKQTTDKQGYKHVYLYKGNIKKRFLVHRLVGFAFIPNPDNKPFIGHINTVRGDNRFENLRWATEKENANNPLSLEHNHSIKRYTKKIAKYSVEGDYITTYESITEAANSMCCNLSAFINGIKRNPRYKGYIWEYAQKDRH